MKNQWTYLVISVLHLTQTVWQTQGFLSNIPDNVRPKDPFVFFGEQLVLNCTVSPSKGNVSEAFFSHNNTRIDKSFVSVIDSQILQLNKTIRKFAENGTYSCKTNSSYLGSQRVTADYAPVPVKDLNCIVNNWDTMTCTWNHGAPYAHMANVNVTLEWSLNNSSYNPCPVPHEKQLGCFWPKEKFNTRNIMYLRITVDYNHKGKSASAVTMTSYDTNNIVKPAKVDNLTLKKLSSRCVSLEWSHTRDMENFQYNVSFKRLDTGDMRFAVTYLKNLTYCELKPFRNYSVSITVYPPSQRFPSDPVETAVAMDEDAPTGSPQITPGAYDSPDTCGELRNVTIFWKEVPAEERNGVITTYFIQYSTDKDATMEPIKVDAKLRHATLPLKCKDTYTVFIRAATAVNVSNNYSTIKIWPAGHVDKPQLDIKVLTRTSITAEWSVSDHQTNTIENFTLFWSMLGEKGWELLSEWQVVPGNVTRWPLPSNLLGGSQNFKSYRFGIAVETQNGNSGIAWADCVYEFGATPTTPQLVSVTYNSETPAIDVVWQNENCQQETTLANIKLEAYLIHYCALKEGNCEKGKEKKVRVNGTQTKYAILDVVFGRNYSVQLQSVAVGSKPSSNSEAMFVKVSEPYNAGHVIGIIMGTLTAVIVIAVVIILVLMCIKKVKKPVDIEDLMKKDALDNEGFQPDEDQTTIPSKEFPTLNGTVFQHQISIDSGTFSMKSEPHEGVLKQISEDQTLETKIKTDEPLHQSPSVDYSVVTNRNDVVLHTANDVKANSKQFPDHMIGKNGVAVVGFVHFQSPQRDNSASASVSNASSTRADPYVVMGGDSSRETVTDSGRDDSLTDDDVAESPDSAIDVSPCGFSFSGSDYVDSSNFAGLSSSSGVTSGTEISLSVVSDRDEDEDEDLQSSDAESPQASLANGGNYVEYPGNRTDGGNVHCPGSVHENCPSMSDNADGLDLQSASQLVCPIGLPNGGHYVDSFVATGTGKVDNFDTVTGSGTALLGNGGDYVTNAFQPSKEDGPSIKLTENGNYIESPDSAFGDSPPFGQISADRDNSSNSSVDEECSEELSDDDKTVPSPSNVGKIPFDLTGGSNYTSLETIKKMEAVNKQNSDRENMNQPEPPRGQVVYNGNYISISEC